MRPLPEWDRRGDVVSAVAVDKEIDLPRSGILSEAVAITPACTGRLDDNRVETAADCRVGFDPGFDADLSGPKCNIVRHGDDTVCASELNGGIAGIRRRSGCSESDASRICPEQT